LFCLSLAALPDKASSVSVIADSPLVTDSMPSIRSLSLKAAKMKGGFVNALKEVGDKVQKLPVQSLIQMPFVAMKTGPMPAKNDAVTPCYVSSSIDDRNGTDDILQGSAVDMDAVDGASTQKFPGETTVLHDGIFGDTPISLPILKQSADVDVQSWHSEAAAGDDIPHQISVQSSADVFYNVDARSEVGEEMNSRLLYDSVQNCSVSSSNCIDSSRLVVNCLVGNTDTRYAEEDQHYDIVGELFTKPSTSISSAHDTAGGAFTVSRLPTVQPRLFSLTPEEDSVDIVFSSKRNSAKRVKKLVSKQNCKFKLVFCVCCLLLL